MAAVTKGDHHTSSDFAIRTTPSSEFCLSDSSELPVGQVDPCAGTVGSRFMGRLTDQVSSIEITSDVGNLHNFT